MLEQQQISGASGSVADQLTASFGGAVTATEWQDERKLAEQDMLSRIQSGDQSAFHDLVARYRTKVFAVIHGILRNREDTEDVAQLVFTKVYYAIKGFDGRCALQTWICKIAINECYSWLRKLRTRNQYETEWPEHETAGFQTGTDKTVAQRDFLNKLLLRIPEEDRLLMILKEVEGHSINELAEMTGLTPTAIKVRMFRARQKLVQAAEGMSRFPVGATAQPSRM